MNKITNNNAISKKSKIIIENKCPTIVLEDSDVILKIKMGELAAIFIE